MRGLPSRSPVAETRRVRGPSASRTRGEHGVGDAGSALGRVAHGDLDVRRGGGLVGGAGQQLLAGERLAVRATGLVGREHEGQRLGGLGEQRVAAGGERAVAAEAISTPWSTAPATSGAASTARTPCARRCGSEVSCDS